MPPHISPPIYANYPSEKLTIAAGVAIFHLATECVIVCYHSRDNYYFLPKGRRNANESTGRAAEREGFEESGYRNRLLPLPMRHRQPDPDEGHQRFVTEPVWTQLLPLTSTAQYLLFWYVAETVPPDLEQEYLASGGEQAADRVYEAPVSFPEDQKLSARIAQDRVVEDGEEKIYDPVWHPNTGVDEEERLYRSFLLPVAEARRKLKGSVMEDVVRRGWEGIQARMEMEAEDERREEDGQTV